jgi:hypothetical protein
VQIVTELMSKIMMPPETPATNKNIKSRA